MKNFFEKCANSFWSFIKSVWNTSNTNKFIMIYAVLFMALSFTLCACSSLFVKTVVVILLIDLITIPFKMLFFPMGRIHCYNNCKINFVFAIPMHIFIWQKGSGVYLKKTDIMYNQRLETGFIFYYFVAIVDYIFRFIKWFFVGVDRSPFALDSQITGKREPYNWMNYWNFKK